MGPRVGTPSWDLKLGPQTGTPKLGPIRAGTPSWDLKLGPQTGARSWNPNLGPQTGTQHWDPKLGPQAGTPNWDPKLGPKVGNTGLRPQWGRKCGNRKTGNWTQLGAQGWDHKVATPKVSIKRGGWKCLCCWFRVASLFAPPWGRRVWGRRAAPPTLVFGFRFSGRAAVKTATSGAGGPLLDDTPCQGGAGGSWDGSGVTFQFVLRGPLLGDKLGQGWVQLGRQRRYFSIRVARAPSGWQIGPSGGAVRTAAALLDNSCC